MDGVTGIRGNTAGQTTVGTTKNADGSRKFYSDVIAATANKAADTAKSVSTSSRTKTESVVDEYKRKHPESTSNVDRMVKAGRNVLTRNGADGISRDDMTMEEYKRFITAMMDSIPFDVSQRNCTEIWSISEQGWEQMKKDPDYEAWVLGYTVVNRSVQFPAALSGVSNLCTEKFGASIEQHIGQSVSTGDLGGKSSSEDDDEETWWQKRHRRMKELLAQQVKESQARHQAQRAFILEMCRQEACESSQRMEAFLNPDETVTEIGTNSAAQKSAAAAAAVYEQNIITFIPKQPV